MKKPFLTFALAAATLMATALPAKRGHWQTLRLADGTEVRAQLVGDEHLHFWQSEDGSRYTIAADGTAQAARMDLLRGNALTRRARPANMKSRLGGPLPATGTGGPRRVSIGDRTHYTGQKKGIVILMQFSGTTGKFKSANNREKYNDLLNKENYVTGSFKGSVSDYFKAQSGGQFMLSFDVFGPYTAKYDAAHYGSNDSNGNDKLPDDLIVEAVKAADAEADFSDYDWDGDGEVDQVFVVYAGKGEADGGASNTIWPHMWWLSKTKKSLTLDGVKIDTYACANELMSSGSLSGIGCFCHEFSHCLGYPDFYDTSYSGWFGMSQFDLMDQGSYNGNSFRPAGYSAYEKWIASWIEPTVLASKDTTVAVVAPMSENGEAFIMYNDAHTDEFYMIENRQRTNWDTSLPTQGLMITHVDFDKTIWEDNTPNTKVTLTDIQYSDGELHKVNDHQRCTIVHADNDDDSKYWVSYGGGYYTKTTLTTDLFPYGKNDSLTATSKPAATLFNANTDGKKLMQGALTGIAQNSDKTMTFTYRAKVSSPEPTDPDTTIVTPVEPVEVRGDTLFYESFDKCEGTGANDGKWTTQIAASSSKFVTDNDGWEYNAAYGGYHCARFGNGTKLGEAVTPLFSVDGEATLTFRAAGWYHDGMDLALRLVECSDAAATIEPAQFVMESFAWTDYTVTIRGTGTMRLEFTPSKRFLLDEVLVTKANSGVPATAGDVNGDGSVDVADIAAIITVMAGESVVGSLPADVNGDGSVDVADIATVIDIMANQTSPEQ